MAQYIDKSALVAEIKKRIKEAESNCGGYKSYDEHRCDSCTVGFYEEFLEILDTLEVMKDPYEQCVQYDSIKAGIQAHAETYSFNIESELFHQLTREQQELWRKEIEQACISGGDAGYSLARDRRYKENLEVKKVDLEKEFDNYAKDILACDVQFEPFTHLYNCAKYFYKLGLAQKGE
jgi:hypothetical protein